MYSTAELRRHLRDYQRLALQARLSPPDDRLASRPPRQDNAPWANATTIKADVDEALRSLPADDAQIVWMTLVLGGSSWCSRRNGTSWREKVGDWWEITAGEINKRVEQALETMALSLADTQVDNDPN